VDGILRVRIAAAPLKGKANKELIGFLSEVLGVSKSSIRVEKGLASRRKLVLVKGLPRTQVLERLLAKQRA